MGKFFRRSGTMTLSATFLTWENPRAALLFVRAFVAYCGKRRKMACERYKEFSQQGIFDHGVGRARARLEWEAFCQSPCLQGFGGDSLDERVRWVGWRLRAWSPFARTAGAVCRSARRCSDGTRMARPARVLGARMARSRSCARRPHIRVADRVAGNELRPGIPNGPIIFYQW